jgi:hypothetical protein
MMPKRVAEFNRSMHFLIDHGIDMTIKDYRWNATARSSAFHAAHDEKVAQWLEEAERQRPPGRLVLDAIGTLVVITIGSTMFIWFMNVTATRFLRAQAELAVAQEMHRVLVPSIAHTIGGYEFFGWSIASGEVGGDLVDLIDADGHWLGYVADVSGHGSVPAWSWT